MMMTFAGTHYKVGTYFEWPVHAFLCASNFVRSQLVIDVCPSVRPSVCLSNAWIVTKRKHVAKKVQLWLIGKSPTSFPMSRRWTAYVAPNPRFPLNSVTVLWKFWFARWRRFTYLRSNAHQNYVPDFTPAFRLSVCHTRDPRLNGLIAKCLLHVRCAFAVRGSGPTCTV